MAAALNRKASAQLSRPEASVDRFLLFLFLTLALAVLLMITLPSALIEDVPTDIGYLERVLSSFAIVLLFGWPILLSLFVSGLFLGLPFLLFARPRMIGAGWRPIFTTMFCSAVIAILAWVGLQAVFLMFAGGLLPDSAWLLAFGVPSAVVVGVVVYA